MKLIFMMSLLALVVNVSASSLQDEVLSTSRLRQEVELLSLEVENLKKSQQSEMDVYIQRDQEVSAQILKEKFRADQLRTQIHLSKEKLKGHAKKLNTKSNEVWLKSFWKKYEESLAMAHPLYAPKLQEKIQKLRLDLAQRKISYEHALLQTWFVLERDLSKSQDAEFLLSPLQGEKLFHVEMVRFGRNKGYFRTAEGQYGKLHYTNKWEMSFFDDASSQKMIEALLTQFKQQQKTGLYQLPGIQL
jgi:hypothetical protein